VEQKIRILTERIFPLHLVEQTAKELAGRKTFGYSVDLTETAQENFKAKCLSFSVYHRLKSKARLISM
jgi:hypothetical protein